MFSENQSKVVGGRLWENWHSCGPLLYLEITCLLSRVFWSGNVLVLF